MRDLIETQNEGVFTESILYMFNDLIVLFGKWHLLYSYQGRGLDLGLLEA